jgi:hypothetical protein
MRPLGGVAIMLLAATGLVAQNRGAFVNTAPMSRGLGVGAGAASPRPAGVNPFPGGAPGSPVTVPLGNFPSKNFGFGFGFRGGRDWRRSGSTVYVYPYPFYVGGGYGFGGGYYDPSYYGDPSMAPPPQQQQPNVTIIMPPQQPPAMNMGPGPGAQAPLSFYPPPPDQQAQSQTVVVPPSDTTPPYLIALKDHTIYSAIAYWVDGDTLHYFTSGNTHNQVSLSLLDRPMTERLNRETGTDFKLPAPK